MITVNTYHKSDDDYINSHQWRVDNDVYLPLYTGDYGMDYQHVAVNDDGELLGFWYADD